MYVILKRCFALQNQYQVKMLNLLNSDWLVLVVNWEENNIGNNKEYLKVMFGENSDADSGVKYKIGEVNIATHWNPKAYNPKDMGGFNFSVEDKIIRWLVRGDTIYKVTIPDDAEVIDCPSESAPHGVFRTNKIILSDPQEVTDSMALEFYKKSNLPTKSYLKLWQDVQ